MSLIVLVILSKSIGLTPITPAQSALTPLTTQKILVHNYPTKVACDK